ncbi:uncharacterized protein LOC110928156 [Helianthus annuus]|uniref:uncharacterized protein LOC110928156 n=1 Tax=Helianthus annuus TaxID=4232 RepID=UPI000B8FCB5B|nr:uncharacterized protein LOC110928156 [Helianthus annuus]
MVVVPLEEEEGFAKNLVKVEYEWQPPRCSVCKVFGHTDLKCPKQQIKQTRADYQKLEDGYEVVKKKNKAKYGFPTKKQGTRFEYRPVPKNTKHEPRIINVIDELEKATIAVPLEEVNQVKTSNKFELLGGDVEYTIEKSGRTSVEMQHNVSKMISMRLKVINLMMRKWKRCITKQSNPWWETGRNLRGQALPVRMFPMSSIASWNIRGLNRPLKQKEVRKIWRTWDWTSNGNCCPKGTRIILGWNTADVDVMVLDQTSQVIHAQIKFKRDSKILFCSFIYADNYYKHRWDLWESLWHHKALVHDKPWVMLGDFNSSLNLEDNLFGSSKVNTGMRDFKECVDDLEVFDVNSTGVHYTLKQKPKKGIGVIKKIDRIMSNDHFIDIFPAAWAIFHPNRILDHSPCILKLSSLTKEKPKPFKFANFIASKERFFKVIQLDSDPSNDGLRQKEVVIFKAFNDVSADEECFLKQKAKVEWLGAGDSNTAFFHNSVKSKNHRSRIKFIKDTNGTQYGGADASKALLEHYEKFLGQKDNNLERPSPEMFVNKLTLAKAQTMVVAISDDEIRNAMSRKFKSFKVSSSSLLQLFLLASLFLTLE